MNHYSGTVYTMAKRMTKSNLLCNSAHRGLVRTRIDTAPHVRTRTRVARAGPSRSRQAVAWACFAVVVVACNSASPVETITPPPSADRSGADGTTQAAATGNGAPSSSDESGPSSSPPGGAEVPPPSGDAATTPPDATAQPSDTPPGTTPPASDADSPPSDPGDLSELDDSFDGSTLDDDWTVLNADIFDHTVSDGALHIVPHENRAWFLEASGPGVVKEVTGDFRVSATVRARRADDPSRLIDAGYQFGGLIARDPGSDDAAEPENYVFNVVGWRGEYFSAETKSTVDDVSMVDGPPWPHGDAELRICRLGARFLIYQRPIGTETWLHAITYTRRDLPATLQVGPIAYTYTWSWNLRASFEEIRFDGVSREADCTAD